LSESDQRDFEETFTIIVGRDHRLIPLRCEKPGPMAGGGDVMERNKENRLVELAAIDCLGVWPIHRVWMETINSRLFVSHGFEFFELSDGQI
jgi:hypothetical protein